MLVHAMRAEASCTHTWLRHGTRWQVVAAHDYLMPTTKAP